MARQADRLAEQLRLALEGSAWHGPSLLELLAGVSAAQAASHPIPDAHSIWELLLHIRSDYDLAFRLLSGDTQPLAAAEAWPRCPQSSDSNWQQAIEDFARSNERLQQAMRDFSDERLDDPLVEGDSDTAYVLFSGITQHNLYHAGQIALLKQAMGREPL